jgi:Fe-S cluster assembly protein SufB
MSAALQNIINQPYKHGFVSDIESDVADHTDDFGQAW